MNRQIDLGALLGQGRRQMDDAIRETVSELNARAATHPHWGIAWSGGKDSTCVLTLVIALIERGLVTAPKSLTVLYADTRLELPALWACGAALREELADRALPFTVKVETVMAPLDKRFMVYLLGRGVPPPNNGTLRWCTRQIKVDPMAFAIKAHLAQLGEEAGSFLLLTGVRLGESAARDARIVTSCSKDGGECGQARFQADLSRTYDVLDPILTWRICHVWAWLETWAPSPEWGDWSTGLLARAYGGRDGDEAAESGARTGCMGCPLATKDTALDGLLRFDEWAYLAPLRELRPLWRELRKGKHRLRKDGDERRADGSLVENPGRLGPLRLESRLWALGQVLDIQERCNAAKPPRAPFVDLLNNTEEARIRELIALRTWPNRWSDEDLPGDRALDAEMPLFSGAA